MNSSEELLGQLAVRAAHVHELQWLLSSASAIETLTALKPKWLTVNKMVGRVF
jgi:hypothetical protein